METHRGGERGCFGGDDITAFSSKNLCVLTRCFEPSKCFKTGESQTTYQLAYSCFQLAAAPALAPLAPPSGPSWGWNAVGGMGFPCAQSRGSRRPPNISCIAYFLLTAPSVTLASLSSDLSETSTQPSSAFPASLAPPCSLLLPPNPIPPLQSPPASAAGSCSLPACSSLQSQGLPPSWASLHPNYSAPPWMFSVHLWFGAHVSVSVTSVSMYLQLVNYPF